MVPATGDTVLCLGASGIIALPIIKGFGCVFKALGAFMSSIAGVESDLSRKVQELERELTEARQQQVATTARYYASSA